MMVISFPSGLCPDGGLSDPDCSFLRDVKLGLFGLGPATNVAKNNRSSDSNTGLRAQHRMLQCVHTNVCVAVGSCLVYRSATAFATGAGSDHASKAAGHSTHMGASLGLMPVRRGSAMAPEVALGCSGGFPDKVY